jgi:hypothetical protein
VTRWRGGDHVQRWAASALLHAEGRWHRLMGWKQLKALREALDKNLLKTTNEITPRS